MFLTDLVLTNYKCYEHFELHGLDRLAVFIGENDAGKTVLLSAIDLLVSAAACPREDFHRGPDGGQARECVVEGRFQLEEHDTLPESYRSGPGKGELFLRKRFSFDGGGTAISVIGAGFKDERFANFIGADNQKLLLRELGEEPGRNETERRAQMAHLIERGKIEIAEREVILPNITPLAPHMPRIQRITSTEYKTPDTMITQTLRHVVASVINQVDEHGEVHELPGLTEVRRLIEDKLHEEISKAKETLRRVHPKLENIRFEPSVDFTRAVTNACLSIDLGDGERVLTSYGEGTKKRLWMGLLEWEQEAARKNSSGSVIRLYDEPDVNLHYEAQRRLFNTISEIAEDRAARTQCFICTHAVTLIDRAPSEAINLIRVDDRNGRSVRRISLSPDSKEVVGFFHELGQAIGLSNTALLYERAFLLVEGRSEYAAIPVIYQTLFGRSMAQDGLKLIPMHTCSAWESVIETLLMNRLESVHLLLDADCQSPKSSARLTPETLKKLRYGDDFISRQVTFVGTKEFEDSFETPVIIAALNGQYPRTDRASWDPVEVASMKEKCAKFSRDLMKKVKTECPEHAPKANKTTFAAALARHTTDVNVPVKIKEALLLLRRRAGLGATEVRASDIKAAAHGME